MSAPENDTAAGDLAVSDTALSETAAVAEATSDAVLTRDGGSGETALPDADPASTDARLEAADLDDEDDTDEDDIDEDGDDADEGGESLLVREGDVAGDYLERLLDILDVDGDIDLDVEGDRASVAVVGGQLKTLIGPDGATLEALQELTRLAVAQATGVRSRLMLDIGGFRAKRRADLTSLGQSTAERVAQSGQPERLSPMNPFERKVVHDVIAATPGVRSESEGEEPNRRVVVLPEK